MGAIGFCPLAKRVGEWRKSGPIRGRGITRPAQAQRGRVGIPPDRQGRPQAETAWLLRQGAGTGPKINSLQRNNNGPPMGKPMPACLHRTISLQERCPGRAKRPGHDRAGALKEA